MPLPLCPGGAKAAPLTLHESIQSSETCLRCTYTHAHRNADTHELMTSLFSLRQKDAVSLQAYLGRSKEGIGPERGSALVCRSCDPFAPATHGSKSLPVLL